MERKFVSENRKALERLRKLVDEISDAELNLVVYKEGWTVAVVLAHLAFWDHWSLLKMRQWQAGGPVDLPLSWDAINETLTPNDAMLPFLLAIPPRQAAAMALASAEAIDRELEATTADMISEIERLDDETRLYRSFHRHIHLDEIEALLESRRTHR
jgi:hypothetical protein